MNKIYFYTTNDLESCGVIKIGQAKEGRVDVRIAEQNKGSFYTKLGEYFAKKKNGSTFSDYEFRQYLYSKGYKYCKLFSSTETMYISLNDLEREFNEFIKRSDNIVPTTYKFGEYNPNQIHALNAFIKSVELGYDTFGLFAQPRFGKTITSFEMMNYDFKITNRKIVFFISNISDVKTAILSDYTKFTPSCNFNLWFQDAKPKQIYMNEYNKTDNYLICCTKQFLDNRRTFKELQATFPFIQNENDVAMVFFDEAHQASQTENSEKIFSLLNPVHKVYVTGTPYHLILDKKMFTPNNMYCYNIIHEGLDFESGIIKNRGGCPEMVYVLPENNFVSKGDFAKLLGSDDNKEEIKAWIRNTFNENGDYNIGKTCLKGIKNVIMVTPSKVECCERLATCFREVNKEMETPIFKVSVSSGNCKDEEGFARKNRQVFNEFNENCNTHNGINVLITLSMGLQSISYPECNAVIFWNESEATEKYVQASFRCKTPNKDKTKVVGYVIDYHRGRCLKVLVQTHKTHSLSVGKESTAFDKLAIRIMESNGEIIGNTYMDINRKFVEVINLQKLSDTFSTEMNLEAMRGIEEEIKFNTSLFGSTNSLLLSQRSEEVENGVTNDSETSDYNDSEEYSNELNSTTKMCGNTKREEAFKAMQNANDTLDIDYYKIENLYCNPLSNRWEHKGYYNVITKEVEDITILFAKETNSWHFQSKEDKNNIGSACKMIGKATNASGKVKSKFEKEMTQLFNNVNAALPFVLWDLTSKNDVDNIYNYRSVENFSSFKNLVETDKKNIFRKYTGIDIRIWKDKILNVITNPDQWEYIFQSVKYNLDMTISEGCFNERLWELDNDCDEIKTIPEDIVKEMRKGQIFDCSICGGKYSIDENIKYYFCNNYKEYFIVSNLYPNIFTMQENSILEIIKTINEYKMKFNNIIANPPYNMGKSKVYHTCINEMLKITDNVTVICPDAFKNTKISFNKIKYYSHKGIIWNGVGIDVSIFELDNNHNSPVCKTDNNNKNFQEERLNFQEEREIKKQEREIIHQRLRVKNDFIFKPRVNSLFEDSIFEKIPSSVSYDSFKDFIIKKGVCGFAICDTGHTITVYDNGTEVNTYSRIHLFDNFEKMNNCKNYLNTDFCKAVQEFLTHGTKQGHPAQQPVPDLNDNNIGDDEYLYKLYNLTNDEIECIKNRNYNKFVELSYGYKNFQQERDMKQQERDMKQQERDMITEKFNKISNVAWRSFLDDEVEGGYVTPENCVSFRHTSDPKRDLVICKSGEYQTTHSYIVKFNDEIQATNFRNYFLTKTVKFIIDSNNRHVSSNQRILNFNIPNLNDNNIGDDEYLYKLYNLTNDEIECVKTMDYKRFLELNKD